MASKEETMRFDFERDDTYSKKHFLEAYKMADGKKVKLAFEKDSKGVKATESFGPETENYQEM